MFFEGMTVLLTEEDLDKDTQKMDLNLDKEIEKDIKDNGKFLDVVKFDGKKDDDSKTLVAPNKEQDHPPKEYNPDLSKAFEVPTRLLRNAQSVFTSAASVVAGEASLRSDSIAEIMKKGPTLEAVGIMVPILDKSIRLMLGDNYYINWSPVDAARGFRGIFDDLQSDYLSLIIKKRALSELQNVQLWYAKKDLNQSLWAEHVLGLLL